MMQHPRSHLKVPRVILQGNRLAGGGGGPPRGMPGPPLGRVPGPQRGRGQPLAGGRRAGVGPGQEGEGAGRGAGAGRRGHGGGRRTGGGHLLRSMHTVSVNIKRAAKERSDLRRAVTYNLSAAVLMCMNLQWVKMA